MLCRALCALLPCVLGTAVHASVWTVSPTGGPGGDFNSLQLAVDAAADGDTVLIHGGDYGDVVLIVDKSLTIVAVPGPEPPRELSLEVRDLAPQRTLLIRGLVLRPFLGPSLSISNCAGAVLLEDFRIEPFLPLGHGPLVQDSDRVSFVRCTLLGNPGLTTSAPSTPGLQCVDSTVSLYDCVVTGGAGLDATSSFPAGPTGSAPGSPGLHVLSGAVTVASCTLTGGQGGNSATNFLTGGCLTASPGGAGLLIEGGLVRRIDSASIGGASGLALACGTTAPAGPDISAPGGTLQEIAQSPGALLIGSPIVEGGTCTIDIAAGPGQPVILLQALAPLGQWLGGLKGSLAGAPPYVVFALGATDGNGALHIVLPLATGLLPVGLDAITLVDQLVTPAAGGGGLLSSPSSVTLVRELP